MKRLKPSPDAMHNWPRQAVNSIETRKRDLVIRIADWSRIKNGTGGFDVECYIGGMYDFNESENFDTKQQAVEFAHGQIAKLLS